MNEFVPIQGLEGFYEVRKDGVVMGCDRIVNGRRYRRRMMKPFLQNGYLCIGMRREGQIHTRILHRILAAAFIPNPNNHNVVHHIDGNTQNNGLDNLEWTDRADVTRKAWSGGSYEDAVYAPEASRLATLDWDKVRHIRSCSEPAARLAKEYGVTKTTIYKVRRGDTWKEDSAWA